MAAAPRVDPASWSAGDRGPRSPVAPPRWSARLEVAIERRADASIAAHRRHVGPLRLQKTLYPEGPAVAHLLVVHPPAGIAGGDDLALDVVVRRDAHALVTTPGATKWYRSDGEPARQAVSLSIARGGCVEWLPQENIVFDGAVAETSIAIDCAREKGLDLPSLA